MRSKSRYLFWTVQELKINKRCYQVPVDLEKKKQ
jgi:hypothetical protein